MDLDEQAQKAVDEIRRCLEAGVHVLVAAIVHE